MVYCSAIVIDFQLPKSDLLIFHRVKIDQLSSDV